jgi:hypothetical protein
MYLSIYMYIYIYANRQQPLKVEEMCLNARAIIWP